MSSALLTLNKIPVLMFLLNNQGFLFLLWRGIQRWVIWVCQLWLARCALSLKQMISWDSRGSAGPSQRRTAGQNERRQIIQPEPMDCLNENDQFSGGQQGGFLWKNTGVTPFSSLINDTLRKWVFPQDSNQGQKL